MFEKGSRKRRLLRGVAAAFTGIAAGGAGAAQAADFTVTTLADSGPGSLREQIVLANSNPGTDNILFQSGLTGAIDLESELPTVTEETDLNGPGAGRVAIDGGGEHRILKMEEGGTVAGLTLRNGYLPDGCVDIEFNSCYQDGGAALRLGEESALVVADTVFTGNENLGHPGGAIRTGQGSGLFVMSSAFSDNHADLSGGAIVASGGILIHDSIFERNSSDGLGGAVRTWDGISTTGSEFRENRGRLGGAVFVGGDSGEARIFLNTFEDNQSEGAGGAVNIHNTPITTVMDSTFAGNRAVGNGGALAFYEAGYSRISGSTFNDNEVETDDGYTSGALHGGGALFAGLHMGAPFRVENSTFTGNASLGGSGGGMLLRGGGASLDSITVVGNTALPTGHEFDDQQGGGILQLSHTTHMANSIVSGNQSSGAPDIGGGEGSPLAPKGRVSSSFSLIGDIAGSAFENSERGGNLNGVDPELGPLADNGGVTETMMPGVASPVLDQGSTNLDEDQRRRKRPIYLEGVTRPTILGANAADMGAVERQPEPGPTGPTGPTSPTGETGPGGDGKIALAGLRLNKRQGTAKLRVKVPGAGRLLLAGSKTVIGQSKRAGGSSVVTLSIKPRGKAVRALRRKGSVTVRASIAFTPDAGSVKMIGKRVKLVKKKAGKRR